jgi:sterigmatocystin 8-O-methyltransferase
MQSKEVETKPNRVKAVTASQIEDLSTPSRIISESVQTYQDRLTKTGLPQPDLQSPFPELVKGTSAENAKFEIIRACEKLMVLVEGPVGWFMHQNMGFDEPVCVSIALELNLFEHLTPCEEPTSLDQLVERTGGASRDIIQRALRVCTQCLCFEEVATGQYRHNGVICRLTDPNNRFTHLLLL